MPNATDDLTPAAVIGELRREVKHWTAWAATHPAPTLHTMALRRVAALEAAVRDMERLDWIGAQPAVDFTREDDATHVMAYDRLAFGQPGGWVPRLEAARAPDVRAAIDALMPAAAPNARAAS